MASSEGDPYDNVSWITTLQMFDEAPPIDMGSYRRYSHDQPPPQFTQFEEEGFVMRPALRPETSNQTDGRCARL